MHTVFLASRLCHIYNRLYLSVASRNKPVILEGGTTIQRPCQSDYNLKVHMSFQFPSSCMWMDTPHNRRSKKFLQDLLGPYHFSRNHSIYLKGKSSLWQMKYLPKKIFEIHSVNTTHLTEWLLIACIMTNIFFVALITRRGLIWSIEILRLSKYLFAHHKLNK